MGIQGLWQILEPIAEPITLESLEGKHLAIDISIWLHQAAHGYSEHQLNAKNPHLSLVLRRLSKLLFYKIRPLFVFDGPNVPIFKKKLLRDRQVKRYVDELTMTKAQKRALQQLASSQLGGSEQSMDELKNVFVSQAKKKRDNDLFDVTEPSTSKDKMMDENQSDNIPEIVYSSFDSSKSSEFDQAEFESLTTADKRVEYLLAARDKVRSGLKLRDVPDDSKAFSNLQIDRLLRRNQINEQLQLVKNEALKQRVFSMDDRRNYLDSNIKLATMEGLDRIHIITDDSEVQILDREKEEHNKQLMDSLAWPEYLERIKQEEQAEVAKKKDSSGIYKTEAVSDEDDDDDDDALQEAIHASLLEDAAQRFSKSRIFMDNYGNESKGDMIERLRTAFADRARSLQHDTWSSSSGEISDDFIDVSEIPEHFPVKVDDRSSVAEVSDNTQPEKHVIAEQEHIDEENKNISESDEESFVEGPSMRIDPIGEADIFASVREEGVYKDCQDLLRICGIPFVVAPGEAEAQCCELERLGLVQGIISDDSDVWLFGASVVYKNMFNQKKRLLMYSRESIQNQLGLSRWEAIQIALLSGGDYTSGLEGVGVVSALELISEFAIASRKIDMEPSKEAFENLQRISAWLSRCGISARYDDDNLPSSSGGCSSEEQRSKKSDFVENARRVKLRRLIEKNNDAETLEMFPSREIFNAYAEPLVDSSTEKPKWRTINMEELELFVWEKLGWDKKQLNQQTNESLLKWNNYLSPAAGGSGQSYQMHITSFTHRLHKSEEDQRLAPTARVQAALQRLVTIKNTKNQNLPESTENISTMKKAKNVKMDEGLEKKRPRKCTVKKPIIGKKETINVSKNKSKKLMRKRSARSTVVSKELQLSEESSNED